MQNNRLAFAFKGVVVVPFIVMGLALTLVCGLCAFIGGLACKALPIAANPFEHMPRIYGWLVRWLVYFPAGVRIVCDYSQLGTPSAKPCVVFATHPSTTGLIPFVYGALPVLPHPWRFAIKQELMAWPIGWGLRAIDSAYVLNRRVRTKAIAVLQKAGITNGSVLIFNEGTRPTGRKVEKAQHDLRHKFGRADLARLYTHTALPKLGGPYQLLRVNPQARRILVLCFSSHDEVGFAGSVAMALGGTVYVKVVDITHVHLPASDEAAFGSAQSQLWANINAYISLVQATGEITLKFEPEHPLTARWA